MLALSSSAAHCGMAGPALAGKGGPTVVELFTSQGCSSCPPADAYMGELVKRPDIVALTLNVDYWDYLGWRDTLGSAEYSRRQRDYAAYRGDGQVYTPQMVIDGRHHVVGSRRGAVEQAIRAVNHRNIPVSMKEADGQVIVDIGARPADYPAVEATVWVAMVVPEISVEIARGENTGRKISYFNVTRKLMPAGMWKGEAVRMALPKKDLFVDGATGCAALLQADGAGPILGAGSYGQIHGA